jgi:hypothetical protein
MLLSTIIAAGILLAIAPLGNAGTNAPTVTTEPATLIGSSSATLNGTVDPGGLSTGINFLYGTRSNSYGSITDTRMHTGTKTQNASANITGLNPSTTYHFNILGENADGTAVGNDRTFTTLSPTGAPIAITDPATYVASYSATLNASVDPHGLPTTVHFEYGTTTSYGLTTAPLTHTGDTYLNVSANVDSLTDKTLYHFRVVAANSGGTEQGSDQTFTTRRPTGLPIVIVRGATNVTTNSAKLNATVYPHGLETTVYFVYGTTLRFGHKSSIQILSGNTYQDVSAQISELEPGTHYYWRAIASNRDGDHLSANWVFQTR